MRTTLLVLGTLALGACANAGSTPRGGDAGGGASDASRTGEPDAALDPSRDASTSDSGGASPSDAGASDAGASDAGRADAAACTEGATMSCTTDCATAGVSRCTGGVFRACTPPVEACNGRDDDCDDAPDDGFACVLDATTSCRTTCGSMGTQRCGASCTWSSCSAPAETCNASDEDCDGSVDEGFRASAVGVSYASELAARHAPCDGSGQRWGPDCNAAIHRFCGGRAPCATSGFGPLENSGDYAEIACVAADVRGSTYTALAGHHAGCNGSAQRRGPDCNAAIHRYCQAAGFVSGWGPVENSGDDAYVACVRRGGGRVEHTTYAVLASHHGSCDGSSERNGPACNAAISRYCRALGFVTGFGPVEQAGGNADVVCVSN